MKSRSAPLLSNVDGVHLLQKEKRKLEKVAASPEDDEATRKKKKVKSVDNGDATPGELASADASQKVGLLL